MFELTVDSLYEALGKLKADNHGNKKIKMYNCDDHDNFGAAEIDGFVYTISDVVISSNVSYLKMKDTSSNENAVYISFHS